MKENFGLSVNTIDKINHVFQNHPEIDKPLYMDPALKGITGGALISILL